MKKKLLAILLSVSMTAVLGAGCSSQTNSGETKDTEQSEDAGEEESGEDEKKEESGEDGNKAVEVDSSVEVDTATDEQVQEYLDASDEKKMLVDARPQEAYSGWALEGAKKGGHLEGAALFSARWLDCEYSGETPREDFLEKALNEQNITEDKEVIVYDYTGEQATDVAQYLKEKGIDNVLVYQASELIDAGDSVVSYTNYNMFLPSEIVKSISDVKTGKEKELTEDAKAIVGDNLDKVVLVDVGFGNAKQSTYFSVGHVPGAVHINTDSYERPRVYVPEKRSEYANEWHLISLEEFRDDVCPDYGITKDSIVILTGAATQPYARLGFMLRSLGVKVYGMSGCLTAWKYNGYALDTDVSTLVVPDSVEDFGTDTIEHPDEIYWTDDIKAILKGDIDAQIVDNRPEEEWKGEYSGYSYHDIAGCIEGSIWCDGGNYGLGEYFQNVDNTPRTREELKAYLEKNDLDTEKTMVFYCGDSWGAAMIAYWCQSVDLNNVKEWGEGLTPWVNAGNEFIDHNGEKVHYDKYRDAIVDADGNDVSDGVNIRADETEEE